MKLTALVVLISCLQVSAEGFGQEVKLTLNMKEVTVGKVLKVIEQKTTYRFVYADNFFPAHLKVSVDVKEMAVSIILQQILQKTGFTFSRIDEDLIVITSLVKATQQFEIRGVVRASSGQALEGVTVGLQNSTIQTATNSRGEFNISVPEENGTLVFSYVGYVTRTMAILKDAEMKIVLEENIRDLNEVVVVGYGTKTRREVTSAITRVNADQFNKGNISNVAQLLQGKVAGLSVSRPGGDPNAEFTLRLRGLSTLGTNAQPLVVIDNQIGADLNTVDPNDIKTIDVLKDGSAAAIYGTRGSAGVIIITTKSGITGTPVIAYNVSGTMEKAGRFTSHMNANEYRQLKLGNDYGASTDWNKEISRNAFSHVHNLSLSGGVKGTSYNTSINYRNNEGVALNTGNQQFNGRLNLIQKALNDKLVLNINLNATRRKSQFGNSAAFKWATIYNPTAPVYSSDTRYNIAGGGFFENQGILDYFNPVAALVQNSNNGETKKFNFSGSAEYEIVSGLKFLVRYAQQTSSFNGYSYSPRTALSGGGFQKRGLANKRDDESFNQLYENTLTFRSKLNKLDIDVLAGYSYQDFLNQGFQVGAGDFLTDASSENINSALDFRNGLATTSSYKNASRLIGFFGRLNLNYNNLAFFQASLRREGSSMLGKNNQWGYFPAVSAGLDISQVIDIPTINNLKIRGSFGITGALPPSPYLSLERLTNQGGSYYAGNGVYLQTYATFVNPNPDLKWERKEEIDLGLDFALFDSRLSGSFDYYSRRTKDLIFNLTVPSPPNLNPTTWKNIGEIKNNGIELSLSYDFIKKKDLIWTSSVNYATYNITLSKLDESLKDSYVGASSLGSPGFSGLQVTRAIPGERIGTLWGIKYIGLKSDSTYLFDDGTGKPTDFSKAKEMVLGNGLPDFEFGWNNTLRYKNFDLNLFFRGSIGHQLINTYRAFYETPKLTGYNPVNTKFFNPALKDGKKFSSLEVENASFVKLDNATIGYNFPLASTTAGRAFKSIRIYFTGQNLFTITNYTGVDPEVRYTDVNDNGSINLLAPGVDRRETWVYTRAFTVGLNFLF